MDTTMEDRQKVWRWCFWIAVAVVLGVFVIPVDSHTYHNGTSEVSFHYTLWNKLTGSGPNNSEITIHPR